MLTFTEYIVEGIFDPGILKCAFVAGGPGSGKGFVAADIFGIDQSFRNTTSMYGLKVVNNDAEFEYLLRKNGVNPKDLADIEANDPGLWQRLTGSTPMSVRSQAQALSGKRKTGYMSGRL
jgi:hypothetical protein